MSSACTCHTDEWCFYCNMYTPLDRDHEAIKAKIENLMNDLDERRDNCRTHVSMVLRKEDAIYDRGADDTIQFVLDRLKEVLANDQTEAENRRNPSNTERDTPDALPRAGAGKETVGTIGDDRNQGSEAPSD